MKRLYTTLILLCLLPLLAGCASDDAPSYNIAPASEWKDGSYTVTADGYAKAFPVTVTIKDGHISAIDADSNDETPQYGGAAIEELIPAMTDAQTYDVDSISGATITSDALRDAVARCLEKASAE